MGVFRDDSFERGLKCDFPARKSFREALLADLLAADGQGSQQVAAESDYSRKEATRAIKLVDADLEMLAAAEGEQRALKDPFEE